MLDTTSLAAILESLTEPILVADPKHITVYMNRAAIAHYRGGASLIGRSLLECHNEQSQQTMVEILEAMHQGLEERLIIDDEKRRVYMRAVRSADGTLLGYYERYEHKSQGA